MSVIAGESNTRQRPTRQNLSEAAAVTLTLALAAASWIAAIAMMRGMNMGVATELGSLASFMLLWIVMMAAMMLPGAVPAMLRRVRFVGRMRVAPFFIVAYLAIWAVVGVVMYALYKPHGTTVVGVVAIIVAAYELTPLKRRFRSLCHDGACTGLAFGLYCVGSSIGLMVLLLLVGAMNLVWMAAVAALVLMQKLLPAKATIDVPVAGAIAALGVLILIAPAALPGLMPAM
ncbi:copper chaperone [Rathayibacter soli]|uniref:copper chaperone n=1 Tax=Rathayibacter soli TaxID=3144168 RepID=UPI0027E590D4|nr:DUF2182 domain-containing protein [Glaciibacter superstes]